MVEEEEACNDRKFVLAPVARDCLVQSPDLHHLLYRKFRAFGSFSSLHFFERIINLQFLYIIGWQVILAY